jgi:hypothetical protein
LFPKEFVPELNTKNLGNCTSFLTITHMTLSAKRFIKYGILTIDTAVVFCFWTEQWRNVSSIFQTQIGQNSRSPKYRFGRQLSQLSDGPINGSQRLVINKLRQSETRSVAETIFLADHTYLYNTGFWQNFAMTFPKTSHTKNVTNELRFILVTHMTHFDKRFGCYSILKFYFSSRHDLDRLDCRWSVRFLGRKMGETC